MVIGLLVALLSVLGLRAAQARVGESLKGFATELLTWKSARFASEPRNLWLNGAELRFVSASTPLSVTETLDQLQEVCERHGGIAGAERLLLAKSAALSQRSTSWLHGVFRKESADEGFLVCLDTGGGLSLSDLAKGIQRFAKTGDLADLGGLRYVLVRREADVTSALILWADGPLPLLHLFPEQGDAPGREPLNLPRPDRAKRVLSAAERDAPYSVTLYESSLGAEPALAAYLDQLKSNGWSVTPGGQPSTAVAHTGDRTVLISVRALGRQTSTVTLLVLS